MSILESRQGENTANISDLPSRLGDARRFTFLVYWIPAYTGMTRKAGFGYQLDDGGGKVSPSIETTREAGFGIRRMTRGYLGLGQCLLQIRNHIIRMLQANGNPYQ